MSGLSIINLLILSLVSVFCYAVYVKVFKFLAQTEREEGLRSHHKKNGTITMGGLLFLVLPLFFIPYNETVRLIVITGISFGIIGMIDDILIIIYKKNDGIPANVKLILEVIISGIIFYLYLKQDKPTIINFWFISLDIKWAFGLFILWLLTASSNAWNLIDGVDALCGGLSIIISIGLMIIALERNELYIFYFLLSLSISLFVFWCFNLPKAFLFMGDVGSLGLGAIFAIISIYLDCLLPFVIMCSLFIFDTISVILQVSYFKRTGGKRLFKMAPFHHHLEACGLNEIQIDFIFYIIQIILVIIALKLV